ncbi:ETX/MTX2 family pore-forming toxin [Henriciella sp.]|uniref:ETX/MTX2 family pore-forming toxin n=1 Tax=Henriciella sp. TaxID=1968823 RepID=UPI002625A208|nr:ETX/MTX2 family pore-forming toxin [Henriciella sp.]
MARTTIKNRGINVLVPALTAASLAAVLFPASAEEIKPGDEIEISYTEKTEGNGGNAWVNEAMSTVRRGEIDKVEVCAGRYVNSLTFYYNGKRGTQFGGPGGDCEFFEVDKTSFISEVVVWRGDWINAIQFVLANGTTSNQFGDKAGGARVVVQDPNAGALRQVNGKSGAYVNQVELMFGLPYYVDDIDIQVDKPIKEMRFSKPKQIDVNIGNNCGNLAGEARFNNQFTKEATQSHSFTFSNTTGVALKTEFKVGAPVIAEGKVEVSASTEFTFSTTDSASETNSVSRSYNYPVPAGRRVDAAFMVKEAVVQLPFTYKLYHYRNGDKRNRVLPAKTYTGVYDGVLVASAETKLYEVDCRTGQRVQDIESPEQIATALAPPPVAAPPAAVHVAENTTPPAAVSLPTGAPATSTPASAITPQTVSSVSTPEGIVFASTDSNTWQEFSTEGEARFTYEVIDRNEDCVYLLDVNRGIMIVLNLATDQVEYAPSVDETPFVIYDIASKS